MFPRTSQFESDTQDDWNRVHEQTTYWGVSSSGPTSRVSSKPGHSHVHLRFVHGLHMVAGGLAHVRINRI